MFWLRAASLVLMTSGAVHGFLLLLTGMNWEGPLSFRKPFLFGLSAGLTAWSLADVWETLPPQPRDRWWAPLSAVLLLLEVLLISLQTWRGVPSHFNRSTPFNAVVETGMLLAITGVVLTVIDLTLRGFRVRSTDEALALAYRGGLVFLLVACVLGYAITAIGASQQARGLSPEIFGAAGVLKFPHGVAMHAVQLFPAWVWLLRRAGLKPDRIVVSLWLAIAGVAFLQMHALWQTWAGRSRWDAAGWSWTWLVLTCVCLVAGVLVSAWSLPGRKGCAPEGRIP